MEKILLRIGGCVKRNRSESGGNGEIMLAAGELPD